jgi:hypothetical protein
VSGWLGCGVEASAGFGTSWPFDGAQDAGVALGWALIATHSTLLRAGVVPPRNDSFD